MNKTVIFGFLSALFVLFGCMPNEKDSSDVPFFVSPIVVFNEQGITSIADGIARTPLEPYLLEWLLLNDNEIAAFPADTLDSYTNLTYISLRKNSISSLDATAIDSLAMLKDIDLSGNAISEIPDGFFSQNTLLEKVTFSTNELTSLSASFSAETKTVTNFNFDGNEFATVPSSFAGNTELKTLSFSQNKITSLENTTLDAPVLESFFLRENELSEVGDDVISSPNIGRVLLSENELTAVPAKIVREENSMAVLDLSNNKIEELKKTDFERFKSVRYLYLNGNPLSGQLEVDALSEMVDLIFLFITIDQTGDGSGGVDAQDPMLEKLREVNTFVDVIHRD